MKTLIILIITAVSFFPGLASSAQYSGPEFGIFAAGKHEQSCCQKNMDAGGYFHFNFGGPISGEAFYTNDGVGGLDASYEIDNFRFGAGLYKDSYTTDLSIAGQSVSTKDVSIGQLLFAQYNLAHFFARVSLTKNNYSLNNTVCTSWTSSAYGQICNNYASGSESKTVYSQWLWVGYRF